MAATAGFGVLSPVLLYEVLLEAGMSPDALTDLCSRVADGESGTTVGQKVDDGVDPTTPTTPHDISASMLSAALGIAAVPSKVHSASEFAALGFTPLASAALQNILLQTPHDHAPPSAMAVAMAHIERHVSAFDISRADLLSGGAHMFRRTPVKGHMGYMEDTSPEALRELRLDALDRIQVLSTMGFSLSSLKMMMWRMALRDPANHVWLFEGHTDGWHDAADTLLSSRATWPKWSDLGFTSWASEVLADWVERSSACMSRIEAAFLHVELDRRGALGVADAPVLYAAQPRDTSVLSAWDGYTISTRVLSAELSATADSFGDALASFVQPLEQDGCTLYFHATTSDAIAYQRINMAASRCALDFSHTPTNGFYLTKLPTQAASWAMTKCGLKRSHPGSPNPNVWPAVVVYRLDNATIRALHRLEYNLSEPFDGVGSVPEGAPLTAPDLIRACRLGVGTPTTEQLVHWIEGPQLLNVCDEPSMWRYGGHQVCVKRADGLGRSHSDDAERFLRRAVVGVCLAAPDV